uniref:Uncharacterized protein n=1 Tax=Anguilla anguilla TaxID=7936 RepID=A0A0E9UJ14_ANGAN
MLGLNTSCTVMNFSLIPN